MEKIIIVVLITIGLVVGGVMIRQGIIRAAAIEKGMTPIECVQWVDSVNKLP